MNYTFTQRLLAENATLTADNRDLRAVAAGIGELRVRMALAEGVVEAAEWSFNDCSVCEGDETICVCPLMPVIATCRAPTDPCTHESSSGIDQTWDDDKVWRCDGCGWLHRTVTEDGITRAIAVDAATNPAPAEAEPIPEAELPSSTVIWL